MAVHIKKLEIKNYRSIDTLTLENIPPFVVFAGPNGAGKSNFFRALTLACDVINSNAVQAIRKHGGINNICPAKAHEAPQNTLEFRIELEPCETQPKRYLGYDDESDDNFDGETIIGKCSYHMKLTLLAKQPSLTEEFFFNDKPIKKVINSHIHQLIGSEPIILSRKNEELLYTGYRDVVNIDSLLRGILYYKIQPEAGKSSVRADRDDSQLEWDGSNLALVLNNLLADDEFRADLQDWMELLVPGLEHTIIEKNSLDGSVTVRFKENWTDRPFPAHLISDGTIHILALLAAVQEQSPGITLIEEPEHGIHPKAIMELMGYLREKAQGDRPIWISTQSETVVRCCQPGELWLVDKIEGRTRIKQAPPLIPGGTMEMDEAWLCNVFGGGLPW